jgi:hypothetical protein
MMKHKEAIQEVIGLDYKIIVKSPLTQIEIIRTPSNGMSAMPKEPIDMTVTKTPINVPAKRCSDGEPIDGWDRAKPIE